MNPTFAHFAQILYIFKGMSRYLDFTYSGIQSPIVPLSTQTKFHKTERSSHMRMDTW